MTRIKNVSPVTRIVGLLLGGTRLALGGAGLILGGAGLILGGAGLVAGEPLAEPRGGARPREEVDGHLVGAWSVRFENGVNEWRHVGKSGAAKVVEPRRRSPGKVETRDGAVLIVDDDDRLERWTPAGDGAVVEHWFPASAYPNQQPVRGIAERTADVEKPPHVVERLDKQAGVDTFRSLRFQVAGEPTEEQLLPPSKLFMSRMPSGHGDVRFRDFFDPRYLKKHGLADRDIAFEVLDDWPWYRGIHNIVVADDKQTTLCFLDTSEGRELFVLRWVVHEGRLYISPEKGPDPQTGIFKPWILRMKVN